MIAYTCSKIQRKIFDVLDCGGHTLWEDCYFETKKYKQFKLLIWWD